MTKCEYCNEDAIKWGLCAKHLKEFVKSQGFENSNQMQYASWNLQDRENMRFQKETRNKPKNKSKNRKIKEQPIATQPIKKRHINGRVYQFVTTTQYKSTLQNFSKAYKGKAYFRIVPGKKNGKTVYHFYISYYS